MPQTSFQRKIFALITVIITVHAFVFYNIYVINGSALKASAGADFVLDAVNQQGGVYMFGNYLPIWAVILIEFVCAYCLEIFMGQRCSFILARRIFDPAKTHPVLFETAIISATVGLMCPSMSFLASFFYYPYYLGFDLVAWFASWLRLVCFNFPFAFFTQLFFIQPLVRTIFKALFVKKQPQNTI